MPFCALGRRLKSLWNMRAILPEWRYWPALALVGLLVLGIVAFFITPHAVNLVPQTGRAPPNNEFYKWIGEILWSAAFWTAVFTMLLTVSTVLLWIATKRIAAGAEVQSQDTKESIKIAARAAKAAEAAATVAEQTLIASSRPWISLKAQIMDSLVFSEDRISITIGITLKNIGTSPATHVMCFSEMYGDVVEAADAGREWERSSLSNFLGYGEVMFQGDETFEVRTVELPISDFQVAIKKTEDAVRAKELDATITTGNPALGVVAYYSVPSDVRSKLHHTIIYYSVAGHDDRHPGWDDSPKSISPSEIRLRQRVVSGSVT